MGGNNLLKAIYQLYETMIITYTIDEKDFLIYQLFIASKSERIKKRRQRSRMIMPVMYVLCGGLFFYIHNTSLAIFFPVVGILWFFFYPLWERQLYIKHYKGFIKEHYSDKLGKPASLEITDDYIMAKDTGSESKVLIAELEEIDEIPTTIFVRLRSGFSFVIPKCKIIHIEQVKMELKKLADHLNIPYNEDKKWKWR